MGETEEQPLMGQRVLKVRDELSFAVGPCVMVGSHKHVCGISAASDLVG